MSNPIDLPLDDEDRLTDPPLIDLLQYEREADGFSITFVPSFGEEPTRHVFVRRDSAEGRLITAYLYRIHSLIGSSLSKIVHRGGGDYTLHQTDGKILVLSSERMDETWAPEVFDRLKQIAQAAEVAHSVVYAGT